MTNQTVCYHFVSLTVDYLAQLRSCPIWRLRDGSLVSIFHVSPVLKQLSPTIVSVMAGKSFFAFDAQKMSQPRLIWIGILGNVGQVEMERFGPLWHFLW